MSDTLVLQFQLLHLRAIFDIEHPCVTPLFTIFNFQSSTRSEGCIKKIPRRPVALPEPFPTSSHVVPVVFVEISVALPELLASIWIREIRVDAR